MTLNELIRKRHYGDETHCVVYFKPSRGRPMSLSEACGSYGDMEVLFCRRLASPSGEKILMIRLM